jgi:molybdopterin-guanine dinucleotide biosynthesis protein A
VVDRVHAALSAVTKRVILNANVPEASQWIPGVPVVADIHRGAGGLAGVHAALVHAGPDDVIAVAWDMPFVTPRVLTLLAERLASSGADACVPESESPYGMEPFCACYGGPVRGRLDEFLRGGGGAARDFLAQCDVERIPLSELRRVGDPARLFLSINDERDLERARAAAS